MGAPVGQGGGAVRAEVALHRLLVGLGRGEAVRERDTYIMLTDFVGFVVFLHCDIGVAVKVVLLPFVLHDYAIGCKIYLVW